MIFGQPFKALTKEELKRLATPPSGMSMQAIWDQRYDTQVYASGADTTKAFFQTTNNDKTLSNMEAQGMFPNPQVFQVYNICLDVLSILPVTFATEAAAFTVLSTAGVFNDLGLLLTGYNQRPTWTMQLNQKNYGPYSLTMLGGTGGPIGIISATDIATSSGSIQYARNDSSGGWTYYGKIIMESLDPFGFTFNWAAFATLTANKLLRLSIIGVQNRKIA